MARLYSLRMLNKTWAEINQKGITIKLHMQTWAEINQKGITVKHGLPYAQITLALTSPIYSFQFPKYTCFPIPHGKVLR